MEEIIWKNLNNYILTLIKPFIGKCDPFPLKFDTPSPPGIARAISADFLNHWSSIQPVSPFFAKHSLSIN